MKEIKRILKIGPLEIYGRERETPNEFTRDGDAVENFKKVFIEEFRIKQFMDWLIKWLD